MRPVPCFDELHVISDLHLGGINGRQIFNAGEVAGAFIRDLAARPTERKVCLVINGDLVDFLAEPAATWFDPEGAVARLERIATDAAFAPVFSALAALVRTAGRSLAITLGNHDFELALPWVRERLLALLTDGDEAARSRITLAFDGAGFRCQVGSASVLCVHGNEVDEWNVTDHEQIRRIGRDIVQGRMAEPWKPNAGTRLVVEVMNAIKHDYPFVDLLKPETQAAIPALLTVKPSLAGKIAEIARVALRMKWDAAKMRFGFLSAENPLPGERSVAPTPMRVMETPSGVGGEWHGAQPTDDQVLRRFLGPAFPDSSAPGRNADAASLLARAEDHMENKRSPLDLLESLDGDARLGAMAAAWKRLTGSNQAEVLRAALDGIRNDRSFVLEEPDETFKRLDALMGPCLRFVIAGHTHLRRALRRTVGGGFYYNTGTWARLMTITPEQIKADADALHIFEALKVPSLAELDQTEYVVRHLTGACIEVVDQTTCGSLREYTLAGKERLHAVVLEASIFQ